MLFGAARLRERWRGVLALAAKSRASRSVGRHSSEAAGTASVCCTPRPPASPRSISASCRAKAAADVDAISTGEEGRDRCLYLLGADEIDVGQLGRLSSSIRAAMATGAPIAPMSSCRAPPTRKKTALYVNIEGRAQMAARAVFPPGEAREDWAILRALSGALGQALPFDTVAELGAQDVRRCPHFALLDTRRCPPMHAAIESAGAPKEATTGTGALRCTYAIADYLSHQPDRARHRESWPSLQPRLRATMHRRWRRSRPMADVLVELMDCSACHHHRAEPCSCS